jgi:DNA-binding CsgD family transcriptional regulator
MTTQADWCVAAEAFAASEIRGMLPGLKMPALVLHPRDFKHLHSAEAEKLASQIPDARIILLGGSDQFGDADQGITSILSFLAEIPLAEPVVEAPSPASTSAATLPDRLSAREVEVLRLVAAGKSNQQIADELVISVSTVAKHLNNIVAKGHVSNRTEAAACAHRSGLV